MADDVSQDVPELINRANQGLSAVRLLIDNGFPTEAVSRAYYAMFYAATALLHSEGITVSKHSAVIVVFPSTAANWPLWRKEDARWAFLL